ncbi:hypothetical protein NHX12_021310, partial [Muraenolepis orangiensis]
MERGGGGGGGRHTSSGGVPFVLYRTPTAASAGPSATGHTDLRREAVLIQLRPGSGPTEE